MRTNFLTSWLQQQPFGSLSLWYFSFFIISSFIPEKFLFHYCYILFSGSQVQGSSYWLTYYSVQLLLQVTILIYKLTENACWVTSNAMQSLSFNILAWVGYLVIYLYHSLEVVGYFYRHLGPIICYSSQKVREKGFYHCG